MLATCLLDSIRSNRKVTAMPIRSLYLSSLKRSPADPRRPESALVHLYSLARVIIPSTSCEHAIKRGGKSPRHLDLEAIWPLVLGMPSN